MLKSQKGVIHYLPLIILAAVGVMAFTLISNTFPFRNQVLQTLYPKQESQAATPVTGCWPTSGSELAGTLAGQPNAIWCYTDYSDGPSTAVKGNNTWVDNFNHGLSFGKFDTVNYTDFPETGSLCKSQLFRHGNHWMRDIAGHDQGGEGSCAWDFGAAMMRPNTTFMAENGKLVIEADAATRVSSYGGNLFWPEFVITTADRPTAIRENGTYVYEAFPNHWTLGCRLQNDGGFTCALLDDGPGGDTPSRVYELSHFQCGNSENSPHPGSVYGCNQKYGGLPANLPAADAAYSRNCENLDPDVNCRDRWRWEITKNRLTWFVNGKKYMEHWDFEPAGQAATDQLLTRPVYVYFGEFMYKLGKPARMHWDRIAINPKDANGNLLPPSTAETFCAGSPNNTCGSTPAPSPTSGSTATPNPTSTAVPTPTPTAVPNTAITVDFNNATSIGGEYPSGVINWSGQPWHLSNPFGQFTTKNISFTDGPTGASFTLLQNRTLISLEAYNGGSTSTTVTIACSGNTTKNQSILPNTKLTITTGFANSCTAITISSTNGWDTNFDNFMFSAVQQLSKPGDLNNDNVVNAIDFAVLLSKWGSTDPAADLNGDGTVGLVDFSILLSKWGS